MEKNQEKNEENKKVEEISKKEFKPINNSYNNNSNKSKNKFNFGKTIGIPFLSGILGAGVVVGTCFGVPTIRENILKTNLNHSNNQIQEGTINPMQISLEEYSKTGIAVAEKIRPSIVGIKVEYTVNSLFLGQHGKGSAEGSGIIISQDGYILTNNHVINTSSSSSFYEIDNESSEVTVYLYGDEKEYPAKVIGSDLDTDLAVIKIDKNDLPAATIGNSDDLKVGEFTMAIGNPLGMQSSVTAGIVSAIDRDVVEPDGKTYKLIQTDAAINSGNSGGALVNSKGEVIGINTLKVAATGVEGMGFAIPINSAKPIYEDLIKYQKVKRPYIGIMGRDLDKQTAKQNNLVEGIYVKEVEEFSAAEKAGMRAGDVIVKVEGKKIKDMNKLNEIKNEHKIGDTLKITINRNGEEKELEVVLQEK